jgi:hypothetical protein
MTWLSMGNSFGLMEMLRIGVHDGQHHAVTRYRK